MRAMAETAVLEVELSVPLRDRKDLGACTQALVFLRLHGEPLASFCVPVSGGCLSADVLADRIINDQAGPVAAALARRAAVTRDSPPRPRVRRLLTERPERPADQPLLTVAVCTRERPADLERCLQALLLLEYPNLDVLVVDNAPTSDATERVVRRYPRVRYIREPRPGLNWARNRAILECRGEILAYTDDDVVVDSQWASALVRVFVEAPEAMAVTGLVIPHELATEAQRLFEAYGGFGRGFIRRWYRAAAGRPLAPDHGGTGKFGTGANMAYRRRLFDLIGGFDPALDVGTCTNGGGDLDMFFRVLKEGHTLVYEPSAMVRHRHRRERAQLRTQIANNGIGFYSYLVKTALTFPDERRAVVRLGAWWFRWWNLRRLARSVAGKERIPRELITGELFGSLRGLGRYQRARKEAERIAAAFPGEPTFRLKPEATRLAPEATRLAPETTGLAPEATGLAPEATRSAPVASGFSRKIPEGVRKVDLCQPLEAIRDAEAYERLRILVSWRGKPIGTVRIEHHGAQISRLWLSDAIAHQLSAEILGTRGRVGPGPLWSRLVSDLIDYFTPADADAALDDIIGERRLSPHVSVSVVVATRDRPDDLTRCLESLVAQQSARLVELIVVDNNPGSGVAARVVAKFPGVQLVEERRAGLSYARNAGILAATSDIIATTDDDAVCAPDWIERLVAPFECDDVMVTTGNVLPIELDTEAQRLFESYGGLGRGFTGCVVDGEWYRRMRRAVPTWNLGCTANAAFRASIFTDPEIGLIDEALGAGTPTGCSEDTYVFYRVLKAGYTIVYEPDALVWHRHRETMRALRNQIYCYSKGHVAYHLTTWLNDGDRRALVRLLYELPRTYARRTWDRVRGRSDYPLGFIVLEVLGNLAGPWALWRSRRRVRRLGRSAPEGVAAKAAAGRAA